MHPPTQTQIQPASQQVGQSASHPLHQWGPTWWESLGKKCRIQLGRVRDALLNEVGRRSIGRGNLEVDCGGRGTARRGTARGSLNF